MREHVWVVVRALFFWTVFAWIWCYADPVKAEILIRNDNGGMIGNYILRFAEVKRTGEMVVIDGDCLSACTLVLGLVAREHICATDKARLGFHAAWMPDEEGHPVTNSLGTEALWNIYPEDVRRWIKRRGGLMRKMIYLKGKKLTGVLKRCHSPIAGTFAQASSPLQNSIYPASKSRAKQ